jgi:hypothetical protein
MAELNIDLYFKMTEMLADYRDANSKYPKKFVLNDAQFIEYLQNLDSLSKRFGKSYNATCHMGVFIEIDADSRGFMLTCEGEQLSIS